MAEKAEKFDPMTCTDKTTLLNKIKEVEARIQKKERQLEKELNIQKEFNSNLNSKKGENQEAKAAPQNSGRQSAKKKKS